MNWQEISFNTRAYKALILKQWCMFYLSTFTVKPCYSIFICVTSHKPMEQSWKAKSWYITKILPALYETHQTTPVHILISYLFKIHLNISSKLHLGFPSSLFHSGFPMEILFALNIILLTKMFTFLSPESHVNNKTNTHFSGVYCLHTLD